MFIAVISFILILLALSEWLIYRTHLRTSSPSVRTIYYTLTTLATLPYLIAINVWHIWDIYTPLSVAISNLSLLLLLIDSVLKIGHAAGLLLRRLLSLRRVVLVCDCVTILIVAAMLYGHLWERLQLHTSEVEIYYDNPPEGADGLRIVQISDLHIGLDKHRYEMLEKVADRVMSLGADIVIDCGDMTTLRHSELDSTAMRILSRIEAPLGVYTVTGNHDSGCYISDTIALPRSENVRLLREHQTAMGWHNITDTTVPLSVGGDTLYLTAIDYPSQLKKGSHGKKIDEDYSPHFADISPEAFNIVIAHTPSVWQNILDVCDAELTLSGHVHAMQLKFPFGERGWSPAALVYEQWSGHYENNNCHLNVTDGVGGSMPLRIGAMPEVVAITLRRNSH